MRRPIFQAKLNHGFWENWLEVERELERGVYNPGAALDGAIRRRYFTEGGFLEELRAELLAWAEPPDGPFLSCSSQAFPHDDFLAPLPPIPREQIDRFIGKKAPPFSVGVDGLIWKRAVLNGSIAGFLQGLSGSRVVMVGPAHLKAHQECWRWRDFAMVDIHPTEARAEREMIFDRALSASANADYPVLLLQCGSMSAWMVAKLFRWGVQAAVLDLGRALDFIRPEVILTQPWGAAHTETLARNFASLVPAWSEWRRRVGAPPACAPSVQPPAGQPVQFVERKSVDFNQLEKDLSASLEAGQWANGGPAVLSLEADIGDRLRLAEHVTPVAVSSGTAALWTAAAVAELRHGGPVRWIICSFGFFSSSVGPLTNATIIDSDARGMLSLSELSGLDPDLYDGLIVTDLFGRADLLPYIEFAERKGKQLVIDAAPAFDRELYRNLEVPVAFSFHHTKPYGFGEGGCVLVRSDEVEYARSISNYGHDLPKFIASYCGNWKMSDLQAAMIAQRHSTASYWSPLYRLQYARMAQIAKRLNVAVFPAEAGMLAGNALSTPSYIALLLEEAVSQQSLDAARLPFVVRKYYRPLAPTPKASNLYSRVVCIPVHPDMAALSSAQIAEGIESIIELQEDFP